MKDKVKAIYRIMFCGGWKVARKTLPVQELQNYIIYLSEKNIGHLTLKHYVNELYEDDEE